MNQIPKPALEKQIRVLVADDHLMVRAGIVSLLLQVTDVIVVHEASNGEEALLGWRVHKPDVGLIDLNMPKLNGIETVAAIRRMNRDASLVVITATCGDEDVFRAIQVGAGGYLLKDCGREELLQCIRAVAHGQRYLHPMAAGQLAERVTKDCLTHRETDVLNCVALGLSNKAIARHLNVAEGTVKTHMKSLISKLEVTSRTQVVRKALQRGLVHLSEN